MVIKKDELSKKFEDIENLLEKGEDFDSVLKEIKNLDDYFNGKKIEIMKNTCYGQTTTQIIHKTIELGEVIKDYKNMMGDFEKKYGFSIEDMLDEYYDTTNTPNMYG